MVWAVRISTEFSEFNPDGNFRGYEEALAAPYGAVPSSRTGPFGEPIFRWDPTKSDLPRPLDGDGQAYRTWQDYASDVGAKFHDEIGVPRPHKPPLTPVQPHEWPTEYAQKRLYKRPAAIVKFPNRMYAVQQELRDLIEALGPGVHAFNPIRVTLPKGVPHPQRYHMMVVGCWLDAFRLEESDPACLRHADTEAPVVRSYEQKKNFASVALSTAAIGDAHLWCERRLQGATFFISDSLKAEADAAGLRLPPSFRMKAV